ncbi:MAG TPA: DNA N-6-adenine-methyltransferase [Caulobacteraceae bacterium]|jgi:hypothetical protein
MTAGRTLNSLSQEWGTPHKYVEAVKGVFGGSIGLDPCSNRWSVVGAETEWSLPETDGLKQEWASPTIYVNPPYGSDRERGTRIGDWLRKCADAAARYPTQVIALVPVAGNTRHWKDSVWPRAQAVCFLYDTRLRFLENGRDDGKGAPMACAAIYWGHRRDAFAKVFRSHGAVVDLSSISLPGEQAPPQLALVSA